jgi:hypothetical protein
VVATTSLNEACSFRHTEGVVQGNSSSVGIMLAFETVLRVVMHGVWKSAWNELIGWPYSCLESDGVKVGIGESPAARLIRIHVEPSGA